MQLLQECAFAAQLAEIMPLIQVLLPQNIVKGQPIKKINLKAESCSRVRFLEEVKKQSIANENGIKRANSHGYLLLY